MTNSTNVDLNPLIISLLLLYKNIYLYFNIHYRHAYLHFLKKIMYNKCTYIHTYLQTYRYIQCNIHLYMYNTNTDSISGIELDKGYTYESDNVSKNNRRALQCFGLIGNK